MDCVQTSLLRETGLRGEMVMLSAAGHHQHSPFSGFPPVEEEAYAAADRGGLLWENFSVDDLLDLGSGVEKSCGDEEDLLGFEDAEEEEEEEGERGDSPNSSNASPPSALSFQAPAPSSDLVVPAGDVAELEWVSRFVDDSYSDFASSSIPALFHHHNAPTPAPATALPAATAKGKAPKARFTSSITPLKRNWGSCCFFTDSLVVPSKARSKRSRTGGGVWSLRRPPFLADSSSSCSSASSASSCSASSSSSSILPIFLYDGFHGGCPDKLQHQPSQLQAKKKKRGRKPKSALQAGGPGAAEGAGAEQQPPRRRCSHCGVDRTPQWRAGPMGAKTLCNACGVRYKSGRLLPEYRPAGSPTFLSHLHSNSHRKVLEMRLNKELAGAATASAPAPPAVAAAAPSSSASSPPPAAAAAQPHGVV